MLNLTKIKIQHATQEGFIYIYTHGVINKQETPGYNQEEEKRQSKKKEKTRAWETEF